MARFSKQDLKNSIDQLKSNSTMIVDNTLDIVSSLVFKVHNRNHVIYISPLASSLLAKNQKNPEDKYLLKRIGMRGFKKEDLSTKIHCIVIPLHGETHWSLLTYFPRLNAIFHYDSMKGHHTSILKITLKNLLNLKILQDDTKLYIPNFLFQQPEMNEYWSCGYQVIYFLHILRSNSFYRPISRKQLSMSLDDHYTSNIYRNSELRKYLIVVLYRLYVNTK